MDKVGNFFFKDGEEFEEEQTEFAEPLNYPPDAANKTAWKAPEAKKSVKKASLISVPNKTKGGENTEIVLIKATSYDDMQEIANHIKERKIAVVNFEDMDKDIAQRMVDFLSGSVFALDGVPRKVSGGTFIFSSSNVDLSGQIMENGGSFEAEDFSADSRFSTSNWLK